MPYLVSLVVGQFDDASLGVLLAIGLLFLTVLSGLALSAVLWFRNRAGTRRRPRRPTP